MPKDYNLGALAPEEKDQLLSQLLEAHEAGTLGGGNGGEMPAAPEEPDADDTAVPQLLRVVEILINEVERMGQELAQLKSVVMDDLIGGIENLYQGNLKAKAVDDLRGKYGDLFAPHADALKELSPDEDVFDKLHGLIQDASGGEGWDEEKEGGLAKALAEGIGAKIAKIKGVPAETVIPEGGASVSKVTVSADPEGADPKLMERIRAMKARNTSKGL